ncbi:MAG TPA: class I SAM-dependent methyltransferase [Burkholderiaceae bacterium]|nr:class I SAM-dependent methyltransferase [Burkholderiaceae bacterium]
MHAPSAPPASPSSAPRPPTARDDPRDARARFWNRAARKYARDPIADPAGYETTLRRVRELLSPDLSVLEVGCGTGSTALRVAAGTRRMLATDVSDEMIAIAREKLAALPLPRLRFEVAAAEDGAPDGARHDVVLAFNVLHLVADLDVALGAVVRSLKPGGLFVTKTPCVAEMNVLVPWVLLPILRTLGRAPDLQVFDAHGLRAAIERHGLVVEAVERHGSTRRDFRVFIVARRPA